ncbi:hypothetical protein [Spirosoma harenae]
MEFLLPKMNRFDKSWYCQYVFSVSLNFLRLIPTYRDRLFVNWSICSLTLVFGVTQLIFFIGNITVTYFAVQDALFLDWFGIVLSASLLTTWLWGIWYFLRLVIIYWLKDWLPLWMNGSLISCILLFIGVFSLCWHKSVFLVSGQLPLHQFYLLLAVGFGLGVLLPTLNNQRMPNKYFA